MVLRSRQSESVGLGGGALLYGMTLHLTLAIRAHKLMYLYHKHL